MRNVAEMMADEVIDSLVEGEDAARLKQAFRSKGAKDDAEKPRMELLPFDTLVEVARVLTYGAKKYAPNNWKKVPDAKERYTGALLRHLAAWRRGEMFDEEAQGESIRHIAQVACNALFLVWFELNNKEEKDE